MTCESQYGRPKATCRPKNVAMRRRFTKRLTDYRANFASVALCYLEGLTYEAAAQHLGVSEGTVRGRLARARERLRRRLSARGMTVPAGLIVAGAAGQAKEVVPASLVHSTVRVAWDLWRAKLPMFLREAC